MVVNANCILELNGEFRKRRSKESMMKHETIAGRRQLLKHRRQWLATWASGRTPEVAGKQASHMMRLSRMVCLLWKLAVGISSRQCKPASVCGAQATPHKMQTAPACSD